MGQDFLDRQYLGLPVLSNLVVVLQLQGGVQFIKALLSRMHGILKAEHIKKLTL